MDFNKERFNIMTRLTIAIKDSITKSVIDDKYAPLFEKLTIEGNKLAERAYIELHPGKEQQLLKQLPPAWIVGKVKTQLSITTQTRGYVILCFKEGVGRVVMVSQRRTYSTKLHDDVIVFVDKKSALLDEQAKENKHLRSMLDKFNTVKSIREGWPELIPYLDKHVKSGNIINVPAIPLKELNEKLGLTKPQSDK